MGAVVFFFSEVRSLCSKRFNPVWDRSGGSGGGGGGGGVRRLLRADWPHASGGGDDLILQQKKMLLKTGYVIFGAACFFLKQVRTAFAAGRWDTYPSKNVTFFFFKNSGCRRHRDPYQASVQLTLEAFSVVV